MQLHNCNNYHTGYRQHSGGIKISTQFFFKKEKMV